MMNWSAKDGARSSPQYGGEGVSIHPSYLRCVHSFAERFVPSIKSE